MDKKFNKLDLSHKFVIRSNRATEDGWWQPMDDLENTEIKHFKKGEEFPLHKGNKVFWRLKEHG